MAKKGSLDYNLICFTSGRGQLECRVFSGDKPTARFIDNDVYISLKRKINCTKDHLGLNCEVK